MISRISSGISFKQLFLLPAVLLATGVACAANDPARENQLINTCLACHGVESYKMPAESGQSYSVPKISLQQRRYIVDALHAYKTGERKNAVMQAQAADLSEEDVHALAEYFAQEDAVDKETGGVPNRHHTHPSPVEQTCHSCHGEIGLGIIKEMPAISHQYEDYLIYALNEYRSGGRQNAAMIAVAKALTAEQIKEVAAYYSTQDQLHALRLPVSPVAMAVNSIVMVNIPSGRFLMGSDPTDDLMPGQPKHSVEIRAFRMGKYGVTFDQYDAYALEVGKPLPSDEGWGRANRPVINVSWNDTQDFIKWLNLKTGKHYRLPSEAEREYAAAAGSTTDYWWGDSGKTDSDYRNGRGIGGRDQWKYTAPVGQFPPNGFGLYDVVGNVFERVADCWHPNYDGAPVNGSAWVDGACYGHVLRGGYWDTPGNANFTRSRAAMADDMRSSCIGFRLADD